MAQPPSDEQDLDSQYCRPSRELGRRIGEEMARDHLPENLWTVLQLDPQPSDHILEVGFGPGIAIQALLKQVTAGLVAGIDYSEIMVEEARKRNASAVREGRTDLRYGEASSLPFADASFDKALSVHSIYFWPRLVDAFKELHRVLKPGGLLLITILPKEIWPPNPPGSALEFGTPECTPYTGSEVEHMMLQAGFSSTRTQSDPNPAFRSNFSVLGTK